MRKFLNLCVNENIKLMKKTSTKILILLAFLALFASVAFTHLTKNMMTQSSGNEDYWKEIIQSDIQSAKESLVVAEKTENIEQMVKLKAQIDINEYSLANQISIYYYNELDWRRNFLQTEYKEALENMYRLQLKNSSEEEIKKAQQMVEQMLHCLNTKDFDAYISIQMSQLKDKLQNHMLSQEEYDSQIEILNITQKYEIGKSNDSKETWKITTLNEIKEIKEIIRTGMDQKNSRILSYEELTKQKEKLEILYYRLEHNVVPVLSDNGIHNFRSFYDSIAENLSMIIVGILIMMTAGSAISSEVSKGSIKFLAMTPNKRWKILLAKLLNLLFVLIILTLVLSLASVVIGGLFFGGEVAQPYLYYSQGSVHALNHTIYEVLRFLVMDITIFIYLLFTLMLSVITRNTAVSVSLGIATYMGSGIVMQIINSFITAEWLNFIPFNNMDLIDRIFPNAVNFFNMGISSATSTIPIVFSICVLGVCSILMLVTMFDSFNRRDIV